MQLNKIVKINNLEKTLLFGFIIPFAFDFKGAEDGGSIIQFIYLFICLSSAFILIFVLLNQSKKTSLPKNIKFLCILFWAYIFSTFITALVSDVDIGKYIRVLMPFLLFGLSISIISLLYTRGKQLKSLYVLLVAGVTSSVIWTAIYAIFFLNIPLSEMRYQILSPLSGMFFAYGLSLVIAKPKSFIRIAGVFTILLIFIFIGLNRTYLLVIFFVSFFYLISSEKARITNMIKNILVKSTISIPLILLTTSAILFFNSKLISLWTQRLFISNSLGFDPTILTRMAEYKAQMDLLFESSLSAFIGKGLGSDYYWDSSYFIELSQIFPIEDLVSKTSWEAGHSLWVYSFYSGGILFGFIFPYLLFKGIFIANKTIRHIGTIENKDSKLRVLFFALSFIALIAASITGNPLGNRVVGLYFGLCIFGSLFSLKQALIDERKYQN